MKVKDRDYNKFPPVEDGYEASKEIKIIGLEYYIEKLQEELIRERTRYFKLLEEFEAYKAYKDVVFGKD